MPPRTKRSTKRTYRKKMTGYVRSPPFTRYLSGPKGQRVTERCTCARHLIFPTHPANTLYLHIEPSPRPKANRLPTQLRLTGSTERPSPTAWSAVSREATISSKAELPIVGDSQSCGTMPRLCAPDSSGRPWPSIRVSLSLYLMDITRGSVLGSRRGLGPLCVLPTCWATRSGADSVGFCLCGMFVEEICGDNDPVYN
ncbi:hypothetical protein BDV93DRAFT_307995 [Ceratobasidium sp. AG-I]|nr:hypothetical protein BDV93DRAFT_307995 [Ceratobasidium sp. AG-I]